MLIHAFAFVRAPFIAYNFNTLFVSRLMSLKTKRKAIASRCCVNDPCGSVAFLVEPRRNFHL